MNDLTTKHMTTHHVTPATTPTFLKLWEEFVEGDAAKVDYTRKLLEGLLTHPHLGVALLEDDYAGLLWVEVPQYPWSTERIAAGWGTYVRPDMRRTGVAKRLWEAASLDLKAKGFHSVILEPSLSDHHVIWGLHGAGFRGSKLQMKKDL